MQHRVEHATPPGERREAGVAMAGLIAILVITSAWWALALWPVQNSPQWLVRTRYACFGTTASGLPDAGGWLALTAGPLGMLAILAVGWARGFRALLAAARQSRTLFASLGALAVGVLCLVGAAGVRVQQVRTAVAWTEPGEELPPSSYPRLDRAAPALALTGQDGKRIDLAQLRGRPVLVTFAYAHCTTVCPLIVRQALEAQEVRTREGDRPVVLIVTLDPYRDPPSRLPDMAAGWSLPASDAWVLSGTVAEVERVLDGWEVPRARDERSGEITHPALLYVVDEQGRIAFASNGSALAIAALLRRL